VFYGGTNTKLLNKHGPMLMENKGRSVINLTNLKFESFKDRLVSESVEDQFYGGTNTKLTNKHGPMLMENKGRSWKNLTSLKIESFKDRLVSESVEDWSLEDTLSKLSEHFGAALDLKKVKVCVVNKNKSFLQFCIFYPYSN
jgi:hypothetical protein